MKLRLLSIALLGALISAFVIAPLSADAKSKTGTATLAGTTADGTTVSGTVSKLAATVNDAGDVLISGKFKSDTGNATRFTTTLLGATGTCDILNLVLGPLDLNLLGLQVHLDQVVLDITAVAGGGLLGDLLCGISDLLSGGTLLSGLVGILNQIFDAL